MKAKLSEKMSQRKRSRKVLRNRGRKAGPKVPRVQAATTAGFPIVGVGASAGGPGALEEFFLHAPPDAGMGFVVVTHQLPGHVSLLPELLRKHTRMPVAKARCGQPVRANCVYLSSAERYLGLTMEDVTEKTRVKEPKPRTGKSRARRARAAVTESQ